MMDIQRRRGLIACGLMVGSSALAYAMTPRKRRADILGKLDLETAIPATFGEWRVDKTQANLIVDPQTLETISKTYTQTLSRTYVNGTGKRIMLSVAYGAELSDTGIGLHYPEVCYPAQGFKVHSGTRTLLTFSSGTIKATQLETSFSSNRVEPVTYWTMIAGESHYAGMDRKMAELKSGLNGVKPDGLLFRVSSLDKVLVQGIALHKAFIADMLVALTPENRQRLAGI